MKRIICGFICALLFSLLSASSTMGQTIWNDGIGDWFTAGNWTADAPPNTAPPDNNTHAEIDNGGTAQVNAAGAQALTLNLGQTSADSGFLTIGAGGNLHIVQFFTIGNNGTGNMAISGGGVVTSFYGEIGSQNGAVGTVTIDGVGSSWSITSDFVCGGIGTGTLTITNGGALTTNTQNDHVGSNGTGTLIVDGMGSTWTHNNDMEIGYFESSTGTVTIRNAGSWTLTGPLQVGTAGTGTLNVLSGGTVSGTDATIASGSTAVGTVNVDGSGSTWTNTGTLEVGLDGNGSLNITNGGTATVNGSFARIAEHASSTSSVTVDGLGSTLTLAHDLDVAREGTGTLMIQNRGTVNMTGSGRASIGVIADSNGTATVDGAGSTWTINAGLNVGENGNGTLHITSGGAVSSAFGQIGSSMGSTGTATIDGAGSTWTNNGTFIVGSAGTGMMTVTNGGAVTSNISLIGSAPTGVGTAIVDGTGSSWTTSSLYVGGDPTGPMGTGLLRILNGGTVSSGSTTVWSSGTLEIGVNPVLNGTLTFVGGTLRTIADTTFPNQIILGGSGILVDSNGFDSTLSGPINGVVGGMTKINPGTIILTNADTVPDGTNIYGGVLQVDGSLTSNIVVKPDGTLAGIGTVVGNVDNHGIVSPGDSPGTLTITGTYTQNSDGTLLIEIAGLGPAQHDLLATGAASLDGTLRLVRLNNFNPLPGDQITILTSNPGNVSGVFADVLDDFNTVVRPHVIYEMNDVLVEFLQGSFNLGGLTFNQSAVAHELDEVAADPRAMDLIDFLDVQSMGNLPHDYDLIAPEELASIYEIGFSQAVVTNMNLQHRMDDIRAGSTGFCANGYQAQETGGYSKDSDGKVAIDKNPTPAFVPTPENRWGFFVTGSGDFVNVGDHDSNAHGYDITTGNVIVGADYRVCDHFAIGIDGGYSGSTADLVDRGRVEVDGGKAGAYATVFGYKILGSMIHIDGAVSGGWNSYDTNRTGLEDLPVRGSTNGSEFNAMLAYGGDWHFGCLLIGTWSTLQYTNVQIDSFTETGSLAPLQIQDQNEDSFRTSTGLRIAYDIKAGNAIIRPEVRGGWQHEYGDRAYPIDASFASGAGSVFTVHGPAIGRDSALVDAGIAVQLSRSCSIYAYYDGVLGRSNYTNNAVSGGVRFDF
jgi:T5SS/PEP-CTERM-associated repeat protein